METASSRSTDSPVQLHYHELSTQQEYLKLKGRYESLQRTQRNLLGEDLGPLSSKDLESLERQLDMSLKQIRSTRTQYMLDQLNDLQHKEHMLTAANKSLKERLMEGYQINSLQLNLGAEDVGFARQQAQPQGNDGFFHPLECVPTLQMGYQPDSTITVVTAGPSMTAYMPGLFMRIHGEKLAGATLLGFFAGVSGNNEPGATSHG
ncbi:hypothetical protein OIU84_003697 [Salix udensis]|uniref:K-box domain-containing protein n=1 Tax=Salix udensis TaxID=889485 RepID=A0AAD6K2F1_9ROSI|nr:hypothetical protein OIU84_003697 [Salix udensis]